MSKFIKYIDESIKLSEGKLTAYKITYDDGSTSSTNMATGVTLDDAKKYFVGKTFTDEDHKGKETKRKAVKVELIEAWNPDKKTGGFYYIKVLWPNHKIKYLNTKGNLVSHDDSLMRFKTAKEARQYVSDGDFANDVEIVAQFKAE